MDYLENSAGSARLITDCSRLLNFNLSQFINKIDLQRVGLVLENETNSMGNIPLFSDKEEIEEFSFEKARSRS